MKTPSQLQAMVDEFVNTPITNPRRKLTLGTGMHQEKKDLVNRLLGSVNTVIEQPEHRGYWNDLYAAYKRIDEVLKVEDEGVLREFAGKAIFSGEEI